MLKRWGYLILSLCLLAALCACGNTDAEPTAATTTQAPPSTQAATTETTTENTTEPTTQETTTAAFSLDDVSLTETPNSSCFSKIGYSDAHETLVLVFRGGGPIFLAACPLPFGSRFAPPIRSGAISTQRSKVFIRAKRSESVFVTRCPLRRRVFVFEKFHFLCKKYRHFCHCLL